MLAGQSAIFQTIYVRRGWKGIVTYIWGRFVPDHLIIQLLQSPSCQKRFGDDIEGSEGCSVTYNWPAQAKKSFESPDLTKAVDKAEVVGGIDAELPVCRVVLLRNKEVVEDSEHFVEWLGLVGVEGVGVG